MPKNPPLAFGDLVAAAYDCAEMVTADKDMAGQLATRTLARWLVQTDRLDIAEKLAPAGRPPRRAPRTAKAA